jgi:hypothetical protein
MNVRCDGATRARLLGAVFLVWDGMVVVGMGGDR